MPTIGVDAEVRWVAIANPLGDDHPPLWEVAPPDGPDGAALSQPASASVALTVFCAPLRVKATVT